jgi:hypothetical protein
MHSILMSTRTIEPHYGLLSPRTSMVYSNEIPMIDPYVVVLVQQHESNRLNVVPTELSERFRLIIDGLINLC